MFVHTELEYASPVWSPFTASNIYKLEKVQIRAGRFVSKNFNWRDGPSTFMKPLNWSPLENCRDIIDDITCNKIIQTRICKENTFKRRNGNYDWIGHKGSAKFEEIFD